MASTELKSRRDGKASLTLAEHRFYLIRVADPTAEPYRKGSQRARAWQVISLMDGVSVGDAHRILELLEPNIQGKIGRPLGWVVDAIDRGKVRIEAPSNNKLQRAGAR